MLNRFRTETVFWDDIGVTVLLIHLICPVSSHGSCVLKLRHAINVLSILCVVTSDI